jgi:23S rRNA (pseudouridine1915-N3)-methyltransferase
LKFVIVAEGKLRDKGARGWADEYKKRLRRYATVSEVETKASRELAAKLPREGFVVALEVDGERLTSRELARRLETWVAEGRGTVAFVIGGAEGIPKPVSIAANERVSLSDLTLPHRMVRVLLLEQLYRAMTIQRGEPYARED